MGCLGHGLISLLILLLLATSAAAATFENHSFVYEKFYQENKTDFDFEGGYSSIYNEALQLTPETVNLDQNSIHYNKSGRIMYNKPFRLFHQDKLASFSTSFVINIYTAKNWTTGHGMAFLIAPNLSIPENSHGRWLGLTNASTDGHPGNKMVAIEFDTLKQVDEFDQDPDGNHIGLNINSIKSNRTVSLDKSNIILSPTTEEGANYTVWVEYNGTTRVLEVYMVLEKQPKPLVPLLGENIDLGKYVNEVSYFGFAGSTGDPEIELNCVLKWRLEVQSPVKNNNRKWLWIGLGVGVVVLIFVIVLLLLLYVNKRRRSGTRIEERNEFGRLRWLPGMPREFKYKELKKATNGFHESLKLGEGGFGVVYKGVLHDKEVNGAGRSEIAVKKFSRDSNKSKEDFLAELTIIHRLRHKNLVPLVGWCYEKGKLLLVYDFMPNGSLEKHLYEPDSEQETLNWSRRYNILAGIASALHYLHNEYYQKVIHRDIKSSNILLDAEFNGFLGDFGLARALEDERNSYAELGLAGVPGTLGYVAPECFHTGKATPESDVFGFGAVVLEVVCGKNPGNRIQHEQYLFTLVDWVWMLHREGRIQEAVDRRLKNFFPGDQAERLLLLGLACSHPVDSERPKTQAIFQIISGSLPPPRVPPFKPAFTWPSTCSSGISDISPSTTVATSSQDAGATTSEIEL